jgi:hypothetical protein
MDNNKDKNEIYAEAWNKHDEIWAKNWRSWGSWFSWGSPVGLGLFFISIGLLLVLLHLAGIIG